MGTTLSSCSHFVAFELLQLRRQATVIVVGCFLIFLVLAHSVDLFSTHRFLVLPFTASPYSCPLGFPCGRPSRTECVTEYNLVLFLRSVLPLYRTLPAFQLSCSPEQLKKLASLFSPGLQLNLLMNDWRFVGLTERSDLSFRSTSDSSMVQTRGPE